MYELVGARHHATEAVKHDDARSRTHRFEALLYASDISMALSLGTELR